ncbi:hypothetical protein [Pseudoflavonifractor phocaeensis]|uniref:hypothetical protein n=1 Tax=Pseudoflavonifractor phocaeensis TaxID=1870988 RepID=UPI002108D5DD|nr:hypothetical protein [Pseudoflavonifractor phocaeensis]MCQ4862731.1 hypothetical protein [Pseudoflavonifractor phocaeensis]
MTTERNGGGAEILLSSCGLGESRARDCLADIISQVRYEPERFRLEEDIYRPELFPSGAEALVRTAVQSWYETSPTTLADIMGRTMEGPPSPWEVVTATAAWLRDHGHLAQVVPLIREQQYKMLLEALGVSAASPTGRRFLQIVLNGIDTKTAAAMDMPVRRLISNARTALDIIWGTNSLLLEYMAGRCFSRQPPAKDAVGIISTWLGEKRYIAKLEYGPLVSVACIDEAGRDGPRGITVSSLSRAYEPERWRSVGFFCGCTGPAVITLGHSVL